MSSLPLRKRPWPHLTGEETEAKEVGCESKAQTSGCHHFS